MPQTMCRLVTLGNVSVSELMRTGLTYRKSFSPTGGLGGHHLTCHTQWRKLEPLSSGGTAPVLDYSTPSG